MLPPPWPAPTPRPPLRRGITRHGRRAPPGRGRPHRRRPAGLLASGAACIDVGHRSEVLGFSKSAVLWITTTPAAMHAVGQALAGHDEAAPDGPPRHRGSRWWVSAPGACHRRSRARRRRRCGPTGPGTAGGAVNTVLRPGYALGVAVSGNRGEGTDDPCAGGAGADNGPGQAVAGGHGPAAGPTGR